MSEIAYTADRLAALDGAVVHVHLERCAKVRNRNVVCARCADACTSGCISVVEGEFSIDVSRCVGCGTCASVCPTCALESRNPCDSELFSQCKDDACDGEVCIACSQYLDALGDRVVPGTCSRVVCLGRVEESLLIMLAASGISHVRLLCGDCEKCAQRYGKAAVSAAVDSAASLLDAWNFSQEISIGDEAPDYMLTDGVSPDDAANALRLAFADGVACRPVRAISQADGDAAVDFEDDALAESDPVVFHLPHVMDDGTLPHFLPDRRERLLDALAELGDPRDTNVSSRLWGGVAIDGTKCVSCRMCATFCPTGAISKFDEDDGTFGIEHFPGDCVKCASCRDICPAQAITILDTVPVSYLLGGEIHRYPMHARAVELDGTHQIKNTVAQFIEGDVFER